MPKSRNAIAGVLALPCFQQRKVKPRKGKGSYSRKGRAQVLPFDCVKSLLRLTPVYRLRK
jgi:stalled ribosome alternative rescue factor ArfA